MVLKLFFLFLILTNWLQAEARWCLFNYSFVYRLITVKSNRFLIQMNLTLNNHWSFNLLNYFDKYFSFHLAAVAVKFLTFVSVSFRFGFIEFDEAAKVKEIDRRKREERTISIEHVSCQFESVIKIRCFLFSFVASERFIDAEAIKMNFR